jgi:hypothetical protein
MNFKTTYILFGVLLLLVGGLFGVLWYHGKSSERNPELLFPTASSKDKERAIKPDDINRVVIERKSPADSDIVFERDKDKAWTIVEPRQLRAEKERVNGLVDSIIGARVDQQNPPENLKKAGLDKPSRIITLESKEKDRTLKLTIGDVTPGEEDALAYVLSSDWKNKPLAVKKREIEAALEDLGYFRTKDLLGEGQPADIRRVKVQRGKEVVELQRDKDRWRFVEPPYGDAELDSTFLQNLDNIKVDYKSAKENDFVQDDATDLGKIDKDLPKSEKFRITVTRREEGKDKKPNTHTLVVLIPPKKKADKDRKEGEKKYYAYTEHGDKKDVVKVSTSSVQPVIDLLEKPEDRRNKNLVALEAFKSPDAIDVNNSYGVLEFRKPEGSLSWQLFRGGKAIPTDDIEARKLIDALTKGKAVSFADPKEKDKLGLAKPDVIVRIWSDSLDKVDRKAKAKDKDKSKDKPPAFKKGAKAKPVTELRFGHRVEDNVAVERVWGKDSAIVMVPASILDQVRQRPLAYYDKRVPGFSPGFAPEADVTKLELNREGDIVEITHDKEKTRAPWKFVSPKSLKGRNASESAVREILLDLNNLPVKEVVAEKATKAELMKKYGLTKPAYRAVVTVTKDKNDTKHTYDFGKKEGDKGYYAKLSGKDTIYLVDARVIDGLKKELRDTTVLNFSIDKVATVKLTGWGNVVPGGTTLTMVQKDGKWIGKGFAVDQGKVSDLLSSLSQLRAERFISLKQAKGLKAKGSMRIEITLTDKKVLDLTLGAAEGDNYHAVSNQLKGEAVLVPKAPFENVRKAPAYFQQEEK